jgi:hypothetical protein
MMLAEPYLKEEILFSLRGLQGQRRCLLRLRETLSALHVRNSLLVTQLQLAYSHFNHVARLS